MCFEFIKDAKMNFATRNPTACICMYVGRSECERNE